MSVRASLSLCNGAQGPGWQFRYHLCGDLDNLLLPAGTDCGEADGLWQHTCLEAFVQCAQGPAYLELNFSPSGQWAAYRFSGERQRAAQQSAPKPAPLIECQRQRQTFTLTAWVALELLPTPSGPVGLTAVLETRAGQLTHWALAHPRSDRPDFHHSGGWTCPPCSP